MHWVNMSFKNSFKYVISKNSFFIEYICTTASEQIFWQTES